MLTYDLCIVVYGDGANPAPWQGSHWAIGIHVTGDYERGDLFQVLVLDDVRKWYHFDKRENDFLLNAMSEATLSPEQKREVVSLISQEPAPRDGKKGCQDWVIECLLTLETQDSELIPAGTVDFVSGLLRMPTADVAKQAGERWMFRKS
ncbi:hypothetical protein AA313_de0205791 [Arthrobotrys entomopaga]|nr:hypothetical protein AA313_de0205791 [Arthrobotrys entomopaga]